MTIFYLLAGAIGMVLCYLAFRTSRAGALLLFTALLAVGVAAMVDLLGRPKPVGMEWADMRGMEVVSFIIVENVAIYLWVSPGGGAPPRAYVLPWSMDVARQFHEETRRAESRSAGNIIFGIGQGERVEFHAPPQMPLPHKAGDE